MSNAKDQAQKRLLSPKISGNTNRYANFINAGSRSPTGKEGIKPYVSQNSKVTQNQQQTVRNDNGIKVITQTRTTSNQQNDQVKPKIAPYQSTSYESISSPSTQVQYYQTSYEDHRGGLYSDGPTTANMSRDYQRAPHQYTTQYTTQNQYTVQNATQNQYTNPTPYRQPSPIPSSNQATYTNPNTYTNQYTNQYQNTHTSQNPLVVLANSQYEKRTDFSPQNSRGRQQVSITKEKSISPHVTPQQSRIQGQPSIHQSQLNQNRQLIIAQYRAKVKELENAPSQPHLQGKPQAINIPNGDKFQGSLHRYIDPSGRQVYSYEGWGRYLYQSKGVFYQGNFRNSRQEGYGMLKDAQNGKILFSGYWSNGKKDFGTYHYNDGSIYTGYWKSDGKSGYGVYRYANSQYEGFFRNNRKHDVDGVLMLADSTTFRGVFQNDKFVQGLITYPNGDQYVGPFQGNTTRQTRQESNPSSKGVYNASKRIRYNGHFKNDYPEGHGVVELQNRTEWDATWDQGKMNEGLAAKCRTHDGWELMGWFRDYQLIKGTVSPPGEKPYEYSSKQ